VHLRHEFLPPVISSLFQRLRFKVDFEWAADNQHTEQATADDDLDDEMKNQSILRTMTFAACNLLWGLVSRRGKHAKTLTTRTDGPEPDKNAVGESEYTVFQLILTDAAVLEQVLLFATSALRVRDTHSVNVVLLALRDIIPHFARPGPVHDFLCHDVLRAAITSLHEPYFVELQKDLASLIVYIIQLDAHGRKAGEAGAMGAGEPDPAAAVLASLPGLAGGDRGPARVAQAVGRVRALAPQSRAAAAALAAGAPPEAGPSSSSSSPPPPEPQRRAQREALVAHATSAHAQAQDMRAARAVVLDLLEQIRGVGIHEMGRIAPAAAAAAGPHGGAAAANGDVGARGGPSRVVARAMRAGGVEGGPAGGMARGGSPDLDGVANLLN